MSSDDPPVDRDRTLRRVRDACARFDKVEAEIGSLADARDAAIRAAAVTVANKTASFTLEDLRFDTVSRWWPDGLSRQHIHRVRKATNDADRAAAAASPPDELRQAAKDATAAWARAQKNAGAAQTRRDGVLREVALAAQDPATPFGLADVVRATRTDRRPRGLVSSTVEEIRDGKRTPGSRSWSRRARS